MLQVKNLFQYDPETGVLSKISTGRPTGSINSAGYLLTNVGSKRYLVHRLIWLWMTGEWPKQEVDHEDRNKLNNKWNNLRDVSSSVNKINKALIPNTGVTACGTRWRLRIAGKHVGYFDTKQQAVECRSNVTW